MSRLSAWDWIGLIAGGSVVLLGLFFWLDHVTYGRKQTKATYQRAALADWKIHVLTQEARTEMRRVADQERRSRL